MSDLEKRVREFVVKNVIEKQSEFVAECRRGHFNATWLDEAVANLIAMIRQPRELTDAESEAMIVGILGFAFLKPPFASKCKVLMRQAVAESYPDLAEKDEEIAELKYEAKEQSSFREQDQRDLAELAEIIEKKKQQIAELNQWKNLYHILEEHEKAQLHLANNLIGEKAAEIERLQCQLAKTSSATIDAAIAQVREIAKNNLKPRGPDWLVQIRSDCFAVRRLGKANYFCLTWPEVIATLKEIHAVSKPEPKEPTPEEVIAEARKIANRPIAIGTVTGEHSPPGVASIVKNVCDFTEKLLNEKPNSPLETLPPEKPSETWPQWFALRASGLVVCWDSPTECVGYRNGNVTGETWDYFMMCQMADKDHNQWYRLPCEPEAVRLRREEREAEKYRWYRDSTTPYAVYRTDGQTTVRFYASHITIDGNDWLYENSTYVLITPSEALHILRARGQDPFAKLEEVKS
jgi:hypothetical protein